MKILDEMPESGRIKWKAFKDGRPREFSWAEIGHDLAQFRNTALKSARYHGMKGKTQITADGMAVQFVNNKEEEE